MYTFIAIIIAFVSGFVCRCILDRRADGRDGESSSAGRPGDSAASQSVTSAAESVADIESTAERVSESNAKAGETIKSMQELLHRVRHNNTGDGIHTMAETE